MILAAGEQSVRGFIEFELIKLAERINVSGNLTDGQVQFIASQLVGRYPNETIADFKLCLEGISIGKYIKQEKLFKLDGVEIGYAMGQYLEEKYDVMENQMMKEKDTYRQVPQNNDWLQVWKESVEKTDSEGGVKTTSHNMNFLNQLKGMTDKDFKEQGQEKPKHEPYPESSLSEVQKYELHLEWCRRNFDARTGDKLPTWKPEPEWTDELTEAEKVEIFKKGKCFIAR